MDQMNCNSLLQAADTIRDGFEKCNKDLVQCFNDMETAVGAFRKCNDDLTELSKQQDSK
jgi:hypothetical protein